MKNEMAPNFKNKVINYASNMSKLSTEDLKEFDLDFDAEDEGTWSDLGSMGSWSGDSWQPCDGPAVPSDTERLAEKVINNTQRINGNLEHLSNHLRESVILFREVVHRMGEKMDIEDQPINDHLCVLETEEANDEPMVDPGDEECPKTASTSTIPEFPQTEHYKKTEFVVSEIVSHRKGPFGRLEYFIKWDGFSSEENTWEPKKNLYGSDCLKMLQQYHVGASLPPFKMRERAAS